VDQRVAWLERLVSDVKTSSPGIRNQAMRVFSVRRNPSPCSCQDIFAAELFTEAAGSKPLRALLASMNNSGNAISPGLRRRSYPGSGTPKNFPLLRRRRRARAAGNSRIVLAGPGPVRHSIPATADEVARQGLFVPFARSCKKTAPTGPQNRFGPTMRAERAKLKSRRDDTMVAQGQRGTSATLG